MGQPVGPGDNFTLLFDDDSAPGISLPAPFREIYGGDWRLPPAGTGPYVYANFVVSRDGRVSFGETGHMGGGDVSGFNRHDQWLMALLRTRADAVLVGDNTLRLEPDHLWTAEYICPTDAAAFASLRREERRSPMPLHVFLSLDGRIPADAAALRTGDIRIVVATTKSGSRRASAALAGRADADVLSLGEGSVDLARMVGVLSDEYGVRSLLCEGGPRVYGAMLAARQVADEFLTLSPLVIGSRPEGPARPSLVEGVAFGPGDAPTSRLVSLRRAGDHLFLRSRYDKPPR